MGKTLIVFLSNRERKIVSEFPFRTAHDEFLRLAQNQICSYFPSIAQDEHFSESG